MKKILPWWLKIIFKLLLSRLPIPYSIWESLGLFKHGKMDQIEYSIKVFENHLQKTKIISLKNKVVLELGPGDSISTAIISYAHGARSILVDVKKFAKFDLNFYISLSKKLNTMGYHVPNFNKNDDLQSILKKTNSIYLTDGLKSLKNIENKSVDMIFSQAVLEHIRLYEFEDLIIELSRIQKRNGISSHQVDLRDHLGQSLNNLRFSEDLWESNFFCNSGFYTNRISFYQMIKIFEKYHTKVDTLNIIKWKKLPIPSKKFAKKFHSDDEKERLIQVFDVVLKKN